MESQTYAIVGPDNLAINFILWDGITEFDYGQEYGNYLVLMPEGSRYGFGWEWNGTEFVEPVPPVVPEPEAPSRDI